MSRKRTASDNAYYVNKITTKTDLISGIVRYFFTELNNRTSYL